MDTASDSTVSIDEKMKVSRRGFLKGLGALSATAAIYGCGGGGQSSYSTDAAVAPSDNLTLDTSVTTLATAHSYPCACGGVVKAQVKNGVIMTSTGAGDIPRAGAQAIDEDITNGLTCTRVCLRAYASLKRTYSPERIKTPLKQTIGRGNLRGFKQITWDEAIDTVAGWFQEMQQDQKSLGYMPLVASAAIGFFVAPSIGTFTNIIPYLGTFIGTSPWRTWHGLHRPHSAAGMPRATAALIFGIPNSCLTGIMIR